MFNKALELTLIEMGVRLLKVWSVFFWPVGGSSTKRYRAEQSSAYLAGCKSLPGKG